MKTGYKNSIKGFLENSDKVVTDLMAYGRTYCVLRDQGQAWVKEVEFLKMALAQYDDEGRIYFEYDIPRMAKRADVVVLARGILFVLEFKISLLQGEKDKAYDSAGIDQVDDYAHDFSYFHSKSHSCPIVPILIDNAAVAVNDSISVNDCAVYKVVRCNSPESLIEIMKKSDSEIPKDNRLHEPYSDWELGTYEPTPTIVQAAEALYANHTVDEITRSGAGATGIKNATEAINSIIATARKDRKKVICFLTGVPGAGKTLVGMNLVASRNGDNENRVFLSGNYPLVKVLQEALIRNRKKAFEILRDKARAGNQDALSEDQKKLLDGTGIVFDNDKVKGRISRRNIESKVVTKIQLVAHFRSGYDEGASPPNEHVFVFDEAQRAWSAKKLLTDEHRTDGMSEPDILMSYLDRHDDWCVAIALVGGGQDIHDGEAGINEWYKTLSNKFSEWHVCLAKEDDSLEFKLLRDLHPENLMIDPCLHLDHPMRSFRAKRVSDFVEALLIGESGLKEAQAALADLKSVGEYGRVQFPVYLCRDLEKGKSKLRSIAIGTERYGTLISARARRLRHYGLVALDRDFNQIAWFLDGKESIDSSYSMEIAATEFKVQGLEIDYALVGWDGDFMYDKKTGKFKCQNFSVADGCWYEINGNGAEEKKRYLTNAYRVILTRARQGMVIFIPEGDVTHRDRTVPPDVYNSTYDFLKKVGIEELR